MAHLETFFVTGLAGRAQPVRHALDRHVNIRWGLNGSGKTSLLRILHAAFNNDTQGLARVPFEALHNAGCSRGLKPPVSSRDLAM